MSQYRAGMERFVSRGARSSAKPATSRGEPITQVRPFDASGRCPCGGSCPRCTGQSRALPDGLRISMESRLGASFSDVRLHTDNHAARVAAAANAQALTIGADVYFAAGRFAPETGEGRTRLAHELVHVEQQRLGQRGGGRSASRQAEQEARQLAPVVASGLHATVRAAAPHSMQRDGPGDADTPASATQPATQQLQLDPEIQRLMLQHYIRWWLGSTLVDGSAPTSLPPSPDPNASAGSGGSAAPPSLPGLPGLPYAPLWSQLPLDPPLFTPLPADFGFIEPDVGALFSAFGERGTTANAGETDVVFGIYRRNEALVRGMPDLRALAPGFLRPLIPSTWRRDIAGALTSAAVSASLKHDYPTPIEVSDQAWQGMTGASTTVIPLPSISFNLF